MTTKFITPIAILFCFCLLLGCANNKESTKPVEAMPAGDNSFYKLRHEQLSLNGSGESSDRNTAEHLASTNVRKAEFDTVMALLKHVTDARGLSVATPQEFYLAALRYAKYDIEETPEKNGNTRYHCVCTAKVALPMMLQSVYEAAQFPSEYGYYQFLRDIDYFLSQKH